MIRVRSVFLASFLLLGSVSYSWAQGRMMSVGQPQQYHPAGGPNVGAQDDAGVPESDKRLREMIKRSEIHKENSVMSVLMFLGTISGAESACSVPRAEKVRKCAEFYVSHWEDLTGIPGADDEEEKLLPIVWRDSYLRGYDGQKESAPISCDELYSILLQSEFAQHCAL